MSRECRTHTSLHRAAEIVLRTETQSIAACVQQLLDVVLPAVAPPTGERSEPAPTEAPSAEAPTASEASGPYRGVQRRGP